MGFEPVNERRHPFAGHENTKVLITPTGGFFARITMEQPCYAQHECSSKRRVPCICAH